GKRVATLATGFGAAAPAFSPDGGLLATADHDGEIRLWDAGEGSRIRTLEAEKGWQATVLAFSPDGRTLAAAVVGSRQEQGRLVLWELASGRVRADLAGRRGNTSAVAFAPDGNALAAGGIDTAVLLWDLTGRHLWGGRPLAQPAAEELA